MACSRDAYWLFEWMEALPIANMIVACFNCQIIQNLTKNLAILLILFINKVDNKQELIE